MKWYATIWNEDLDEILESHGPYTTEAAARSSATRLHKETSSYTGVEARHEDGTLVKGEGGVWPKTDENGYEGN